jgi:hypothetical protein
MHTGVDDPFPVHTVLLVQESIVPSLNVFQDGSPRVFVVDEIAESGGINHCQLQFDSVLLNIRRDGLDFDGFGNLDGRLTSFLGGVQGGVEEGVDEGGFSETRFTNDHDGELEALFDRFAVDLVGQAVEAHRAEDLFGDDGSLYFKGNRIVEREREREGESKEGEIVRG